MPFVKYCLLCKEELKIFRKPTQSVDFTVTGPEMYSKQAETEVVPSSSLVEVEVEVEVGVGAWVEMQFSFLTFSVRWVGGRRNGD